MTVAACVIALLCWFYALYVALVMLASALDAYADGEEWEAVKFAAFGSSVAALLVWLAPRLQEWASVFLGSA